MFTNLTPKKKLIYTVVAVLIAAAVTVGTIFLVRSINDNSSTNNTDTSKDSADTLKTQAIEALKTDSDKAKTLFEEAKQKYDDAGDTNNSVDMAAQLYLLEHK